MNSTSNKVEAFHSLHIKGDPVVLYNIWDAGSAKVVAQSGARAIATGSWPVAAAFGYGDGEQLPLDIALANIKRISEAVDLPVTMDLEAGYGQSPEDVAGTVSQAIRNGAIGFNLEDQIIGATGLYDVKQQFERITAARTAADAMDVRAFINARTDIFLKAGKEDDKIQLFEQVLIRAEAYHKAGCDGFFVPGLIDAELIGKLCEISPLPVNIMMMPGCPTKDALAALGVSRISHGPGPYRAAMALLESECKKTYA